ncbi:hypothetical protein CLOP_g20155 [Closterium sp. NIES-67]|nr:hypothetical protein CLOP_g20155 [Closterium sp. NIES-67]
MTAMDASRHARVRLAPQDRSQRGDGGGASGKGREREGERESRESRRRQLQRSLDEARKPFAAALAVAWKGSRSMAGHVAVAVGFLRHCPAQSASTACSDCLSSWRPTRCLCGVTWRAGEQ